MSWYSLFRTAFFSEWSHRGLPESTAADQAEVWPIRSCPLRPEAASPGSDRLSEAESRALASPLIDSVYSFGAFIGQGFGNLFSVGTRRAEAAADFCGRFNLGISLFDFLCDEDGGRRMESLQAVPALAPFTGRRMVPISDQGPIQHYLNRMVESVLADVSRQYGRPTGEGGYRGPWRTLYSMFDGEVQRTRSALRGPVDIAALSGMLRLSSAEPFRFMSEWTARTGALSSSSVREAALLGRRVGTCYWLIDDAKDVWDDLHAGRWNHFLLAAKVAQPRLSFAQASPLLEGRLLDIWRSKRIAEKSCRSIIGGMARAIDRIGAGNQRPRTFLRRIHASMLRWYG